MNPAATSSTWTLPAPAGFIAQLGRSLAADALKLRRTPALWLTLAGGALPALLNFAILFFKGQYIIKPGIDAWVKYASMSWQTATILLPLFVVLLVSLVVSLEDRAQGWKHVFALPVGRLPLWLSKLVVLLGLNLLAQVLFVLLLLAFGYLLQGVRPALHFAQYSPPMAELGRLLMRTYVASLGILGVQYLLSRWWQGFVLPVAVGMAGWVAGLTLLRWEHVGWVPYAEPMQTLFLTQVKPKAWIVASSLVAHEWYSLVWFAAAAVLGYVVLRWRNLA